MLIRAIANTKAPAYPWKLHRNYIPTLHWTFHHEPRRHWDHRTINTGTSRPSEKKTRVMPIAKKKTHTHSRRKFCSRGRRILHSPWCAQKSPDAKGTNQHCGLCRAEQTSFFSLVRLCVFSIWKPVVYRIHVYRYRQKIRRGRVRELYPTGWRCSPVSPMNRCAQQRRPNSFGFLMKNGKFINSGDCAIACVVVRGYMIRVAARRRASAFRLYIGNMYFRHCERKRGLLDVLGRARPRFWLI